MERNRYFSPDFVAYTKGAEGCCGRCYGALTQPVSWSVAFDAWLCVFCREVLTAYVTRYDDESDPLPISPFPQKVGDPRDDPCGGGPMRGG